MNSTLDKALLKELEHYDRELRERDEQIYFLKEDIKRLEKDCLIDRRSELYSPAFLDARLKEEIARSERYRHYFSLILIHVEPRPADSTQHIVERLRAIGREISAVLSRKGDVLANVNKSQIVVILPETEVGGAEVVLARYRAMLDASHHPLHYAILSYPRDASNVEMLLARIDEAGAKIERATIREKPQAQIERVGDWTR